MATTPRRAFRRASVGREGDIARNDVVDSLEARVRAFLAKTTGGAVHVLQVERDSLTALFVCTPNSVEPEHEATICRELARGLDPVGWSAFTDLRMLRVPGGLGTTMAHTKTLVLMYRSRAVGGPSFGCVLVRVVVLACVALFLVFNLYWLLFQARG